MSVHCGISCNVGSTSLSKCTSQNKIPVTTQLDARTPPKMEQQNTQSILHTTLHQTGQSNPPKQQGNCQWIQVCILNNHLSIPSSRTSLTTARSSQQPTMSIAATLICIDHESSSFLLHPWSKAYVPQAQISFEGTQHQSKTPASLVFYTRTFPIIWTKNQTRSSTCEQAVISFSAPLFCFPSLPLHLFESPSRSFLLLLTFLLRRFQFHDCALLLPHVRRFLLSSLPSASPSSKLSLLPLPAYSRPRHPSFVTSFHHVRLLPISVSSYVLTSALRLSAILVRFCSFLPFTYLRDYGSFLPSSIQSRSS